MISVVSKTLLLKQGQVQWTKLRVLKQRAKMRSLCQRAKLWVLEQRPKLRVLEQWAKLRLLRRWAGTSTAGSGTVGQIAGSRTAA